MRQQRYVHGDADCSLDDPWGNDAHHDLGTLGDTIPDPEPSLPHEDAFDLRAALARVDKRGRLVLRLIYEDGFTLTEVGAVVGLSKEGAFQVKKAALEALRAAAS